MVPELFFLHRFEIAFCLLGIVTLRRKIVVDTPFEFSEHGMLFIRRSGIHGVLSRFQKKSVDSPLLLRCQLRVKLQVLLEGLGDNVVGKSILDMIDLIAIEF